MRRTETMNAELEAARDAYEREMQAIAKYLFYSLSSVIILSVTIGAALTMILH